MGRILGILFVLGLSLSTCALSARAGDPTSLSPAMIKRLNELSQGWANEALYNEILNSVPPRYSPENVSSVERRVLDQKGYDPNDAGLEGALACTDNPRSSHQANYKNLVAFGEQSVAILKAQQLVWTAVGFAKLYNEHRADKKLDFKYQTDPSKDGIDNAIRTLSGINALSHARGEGVDWCAAFISILTRIVDEEYPSGVRSQIWSSGGKSAPFASAKKLLEVFDPMNPYYRGLKPRPKNSFLNPFDKPIPGCIAVYSNGRWLDRHGHVGLVVSVTDYGNNHGQMETIEGNTSPAPGSSERGIFEKKRSWGVDQFVKSGSETLEYRGCILPWPGMTNSGRYLSNACTRAVSQSTEKALGEFLGSSGGKVSRGASKAGTIW